jgi:hypothetical protein
MLHIRVYTDPLSDSMAFSIVEKINNKITHIATPVNFEMVPVQNYGMRQLPTFCLEHEVIQELYNQLTKDGYRATDQSYIEGELNATKEHLKDMQRIVFKGK